MKKNHFFILFILFASILSTSCKSNLIGKELKYKEDGINYYHTLTLSKDGTFKYYLSNIVYDQEEHDSFFIELISGTYDISGKTFSLWPKKFQMFLSGSDEKFYETTANYSEEQIEMEFSSFRGTYEYKIYKNYVSILPANGQTKKVYEISKIKK